MFEQQLMKLLLNKEFYDKNKAHLSRSLFTNGTGAFLDTVQRAHDEYGSDLSMDELKALHMEKYNPALSETAKESFELLCSKISGSPEPNGDIAEDIIKSLYIKNMGHRLALLATEAWNSSDNNKLVEAKRLLEEMDEGAVSSVKYEFVTDDVHELFAELNATAKWQFNLETLSRRVNGIGPGTLTIIFGRPEVGKTAFWVNVVAGERGFLDQGAQVHCVCNEEPGCRPKSRMMMAWSDIGNNRLLADPLDTEDMTKERVELRDEMKRLWRPIMSGLHMPNHVVDWDMNSLDAYVAAYSPDIIIIDQLDKMGIEGNFARTDEKLRAIYTSAREIAKRRNCAVIAVSQASADASGRYEVPFSMMENSRTGKAAEADLIIGVGKSDAVDSEDHSRGICISKNKITGWHGTIGVILDPQTSRYTI